MSATYKKAYQNWKVSGYNEGIESVPFVQFPGGWVHYLHQMLEPHPDLLKAITAELPEDVFAETGFKKGRVRKQTREQSDDKSIANYGRRCCATKQCLCLRIIAQRKHANKAGNLQRKRGEKESNERIEKSL